MQSRTPTESPWADVIPSYWSDLSTMTETKFQFNSNTLEPPRERAPELDIQGRCSHHGRAPTGASFDASHDINGRAISHDGHDLLH